MSVTYAKPCLAKRVLLILTCVTMAFAMCANLAWADETVELGDDANGVVVQSDQETVTVDNFYSYFDATGCIKSTAPQTLVFEGSFEGLSVDTITINRMVTIQSNQAYFKNVCFVIQANSVTVDGITIDCENTAKPAAIVVQDANYVTLKNNTLNVVKNESIDQFAIYASNANNLSLSQNNITYVGDNGNDTINKAVLVEGTTNVRVLGVRLSNNVVTASLPNVPITWSEIPWGSGNWKSYWKSCGIDFLNCDAELNNNQVTVTSSDIYDFYPTLIAVGSCDTLENNTTLKLIDNQIDISGQANGNDYDYVYAIETDGTICDVQNNTITVNNKYYASAINVAGPADMVNIAQNTITVRASDYAYGIYVSSFNGSLGSASVAGNEFDLSASLCVGIDSDSYSTDDVFSVANNTIQTAGRLLYGIKCSGRATAQITQNDISAKGTNEQLGFYEAYKDTDGKEVSCGIVANQASIQGNSIVTTGLGVGATGGTDTLTVTDANMVETTYDWTIDLKGSASTVTGNILTAKNALGDDTVREKDNATVADNGPVTIDGATVTLSKKSLTFNSKVQKPAVKAVILSGNTIPGSKYSVTYSNKKSKNVGTYTVTVTAKSGSGYIGKVTATYKIVKAANPLAVKGKTAKVRYSSLKKGAQKLAVSKTIAFTKKGAGTLAYAFGGVSASKYKSYFKVEKNSGQITVKKGLPKGTYKVKVKVKAAGNKNYKPSGVKTATVKVQVP